MTLFQKTSGLFLIKLPDRNYNSQSEVRLFLINGWLLKFRLTYPFELADYVSREIDLLIKYLKDNYK